MMAMAIKAHVRQDSIKAQTPSTSSVKAEHINANVNIDVYHTSYTGETTVTPSTSAVVLLTSGYKMDTNITVEPIPSNYGLITWNGSVLTVS